MQQGTDADPLFVGLASDVPDEVPPVVVEPKTPRSQRFWKPDRRPLPGLMPAKVPNRAEQRRQDRIDRREAKRKKKLQAQK